jgi:hypothetical protein
VREIAACGEVFRRDSSDVEFHLGHYAEEGRCVTMCAMRWMRVSARGRFVLATVLLAVLPVKVSIHAQTGPLDRAKLDPTPRTSRSSPSDLEVAGDFLLDPLSRTRYFTREELLALPQQKVTVADDSNFVGPTEISGVLLETLGHYLGANPNGNMVVAICDDKYQADYSEDYMKAHHPILVLTVNGLPPSGWPKDSGGHGFSMGPYMISHSNFKPAFRILAHDDEPQIPWGVVRLEFRRETAVFFPINPRFRGPVSTDVMDGYNIARQNCFRCHNSGKEGGLKSGVTWTALGAMAANSPDFFAAYVRDPRAKNPDAEMPGRADYDDATTRALIAYFRVFAPREAH